jgi:predicted ATPase
MVDRTDFRRWNVTRLELEAWRNFNRRTEINLRARTFFVGPNASGKSNILDALRFLRDIAGLGLDEAVALRGGMRQVRSLHARQFPGVRISVDVGPRDGSARWSYELHFRNHPNRHRPVVERECVRMDEAIILDRPDRRDQQDAERLTQTHLEQVSENQEFRVLSGFFGSIRYLHLVPQVVREFTRNSDPRGRTPRGDDPYGSDFLQRVADTNQRSREARLRKIQAALRWAVPHFDGFELERDSSGNWHLNATYNHWRAHSARQSEAAFSDGTLRLLGLFWALADSGGPLLLEEPELSLHDALVSRLATLMARMNRTSGRQVLVTTHSAALLRDEGIDLAEVYLLEPGEEGTVVVCAADLDDVRALVEGNLTPGEAIMPRAAPKDIHQFSFDF